MQIKNNQNSHSEKRASFIAMNIFVLLFGMIACGISSYVMGKEVNWDLANYHYYNPFAFLYHRAALDYWPIEFMHVHLTPTADFLTYFFITYLPPKLAVFSLGALHGINFWLLFVVACNVFRYLPRLQYPRLLSFVLAVLGMYGPTSLPGLGSFQHDQLLSLFVLGFVALFLKADQSYLQHGKLSRILLISSGFMLGIAAGLKLTAAIFVVGGLLSVVAMNFSVRQRLQIIILLAGGIGAGMMLTSGYWMLMQWQQYHNPVFPFLNGLFQSTDFPAYNWSDTRFVPKSWLEAMLFPLYFSFDGRTGDLPFRDIRFSVVYILFLLSAVKILAGYFSLAAKQQEIPMMAKWLFTFFILSYVVWQVGFSIMRYAMPLEMLAPLLIVLLLYYLSRDSTVILASGTVIFILMVLMMAPVKAIRMRDYTGDYFNVKLPSVVQRTNHAMVLMAFPAYVLYVKPRPQTYLIPFLPHQWRYVGVAFNKGNYYQLSEQAMQRVQKFNGQVFLMASSEYMPKMNQLARQLGLLADGSCGQITSDRQYATNEDIKLCPYKKA